MAEYSDNTASPLNGKKHQTPAKNRRTPRAREHGGAFTDGSVSDSVAHFSGSPRAKKQHHLPQQHLRHPPQHQNPSGKTNTQKQRPASMGGNYGPMTPAKEQAYAGPTFQASPAASALPVPKLFSRSMPKDPTPLQARLDKEKSFEPLPSSPESDFLAPAPIPREVQHSPLDVFFKADRAERQRTQSDAGNPANQRPQELRQPMTEPRNSFRQPDDGVFLHGPRAAPQYPYSLHSPGAHQSHIRPASATQPPQSGEEQKRDAYTETLKNFLFNASETQRATPPHMPPAPPHSTSDFHTPSPFQRPASGPSTPNHTADAQRNYSLHYGNRNLSPMFKAVREDTPPRPSSLRQELGRDGDVAPAMGPFSPPSAPNPHPSRPDYTNHHAAGPSMPLFAHPQAPPPNANFNAPHYPYQHHPNAPQPAPPPNHSRPPPEAPNNINPQPSGAAAAAASPDIRSMEDDLRRMLKLNAVS